MTAIRAITRVQDADDWSFSGASDSDPAVYDSATGGLKKGTAGSADKLGLTPTAVKTSGYTAAAGDLVPVDTTSGPVTITLPNAPADKSVVAVKHVIQGGTNAITINCAGSDVFNKAGGSTSATLSLLAQGLLIQYKASSAIWYVVADDLPLSQLSLDVLAGAKATAANWSNNSKKITSLANGADKADAAAFGQLPFSGVMMALLPAGALAVTVPPGLTSTGRGALTSGQVVLQAIYLPAGLTITSVTFITFTTAGSSLTHQVFGIYDSGLSLLRSTVDDTSAAWPAATAKTLNLTSTYTTVTAGLYYLGFLVTASTMPSLLSAANYPAGVQGLTPFVSGLANTSQTSLPSTATYAATGNTAICAYVS